MGGGCTLGRPSARCRGYGEFGGGLEAGVKNTKCNEKFGLTLDNFSVLYIPEEFELHDMFSLANVSNLLFFLFPHILSLQHCIIFFFFSPLSLWRNEQKQYLRNNSLATAIYF